VARQVNARVISAKVISAKVITEKSQAGEATKTRDASSQIALETHYEITTQQGIGLHYGQLLLLYR
jgi:hypothetical protein